jgi:Skp family chaperone for outer membrane proteins
MGANIIKGLLVAAFDILMNKLGPISTALRAVANGVRSAFSGIAGFVSSAFNNVGKAIENFINFAIKGINLLIRAYNAIPLVSDIAEIAEFSFSKMSGATDQAASAANNLANQVGGYAGQVMRGNKAVDAAYNSNLQVAKSFDSVGTAATNAGNATEKSGGKAKEAANKYKENFTAVQQHLTGIVDDIKSKMADMASSVSSSLMRGFNFGDALKDTDEEGKKLGTTFIERLNEQANKVTGFAQKIKDLMALGLGINSPLMQAVIAEGAGSGTKIAEELIASGAAGIDQAQGMLEAAQGAADEIGTLAAGSFYQAGLDSAQQTLQAFVDRFGVEGKGRKRLMTLMDNLANAMKRDVTITVTTINRSINGNKVEGKAKGGPVSANTTYLVGERGPELLMMGNTPGNIIPNHALTMTGRSGGSASVGGSGSIINLTVNAGMGTQGAEVGRQIVDALKAYERRNGSVYVSA